MVATRGLVKVSSSHHEVHSDGEVWVKVARDDTLTAADEILVDARVLSALAVDVSIHEWTDGRTAHMTPTLGRPCTAERYEASAVLAALRRCWTAVAPSTGPVLADSSVMIERTVEKVQERVHDRQDREILLSCLPRTWPEGLARLQRGVCHTDPHAGNLLVSDNDELVLIDWESAVYGPAVLDEACVAFSLWFAGRHDEAVNSMSDSVLSAPIVATKAVSAASWAHPRLGRDAMFERLRAGDDLLRACALVGQA